MGSPVTSSALNRRRSRRLEAQHEPERSAREVHLARCLRDREAEDLEVVEGAEVTDVAAQADFRAEEQHHAAARAPGEVGVADIDAAAAEVGVGVEHAGAEHSVRTDAESFLAAERNAEQHAPRRGDRAAAADIGLAVEVRAVAEIALEAEHAAAHPAEAGAEVELTGVERV